LAAALGHVDLIDTLLALGAEIKLQDENVLGMAWGG
jgi:hypothetical protein